MENNSPVLADSPSSLKPIKPKNKLFALLIGGSYGISTIVVLFPSILLFLLYILVVLSYLWTNYSANSSTLSDVDFDTMMKAVAAIVAIITILLGIMVGLVSGFAAFRSAQNSGSIRNAAWGTLSYIVVGLIGIFAFPIVGMVVHSVILIIVLATPNSLLEIPLIRIPFGILIVLMTAGSESGLVFGFILPLVIGAFFAYFTALLSGVFVHNILARRAKKSVQT